MSLNMSSIAIGPVFRALFAIFLLSANTDYCLADAFNLLEPTQCKQSEWKGFSRYDFKYDGRDAIVVAPKSVASGKPWIWRARFFGHEPQVDIALLNEGFHVGYSDVSGLFGNPKAVAHWDAFYDYLTKEQGFAKRVVLEGMSRGGLIVYNWAITNPQKVACIYADAPVCDIRSWPGGMGVGKGATKEWELCKKSYGLAQQEVEAFVKGPLNGLESLSKAAVPLFHVCGVEDEVVPMAENTDLLEARYLQLGGSIDVVRKQGVGHHPHSLKDPQLIVDFILKHTISSE